jgi:hypothetical protein
MTDTYDKENFWFGWNGGECPVHPETEVEVMTSAGSILSRQAGLFNWNYPDMPSTIIAFRITRLYREPRKAREWWIVYADDGLGYSVYETKFEAVQFAGEVIHVREVLGDDDAH